MKTFVSSVFVGLVILALAPTGVMATPVAPSWMTHDGFEWCIDPPNDGLLPGGDGSGGFSFEIYGIGTKLVGSTLVVIVETNFPWTGASGNDTYGSGTFSPGDLYISVGGMFQANSGAGSGTLYGIATTNHANELNPANPDNGAWTPVNAGTLYQAGPVGNGRMFATGTYEGYNTAFPNDGGNDPYGRANNYPTLIRNGVAVAGGTSSVAIATNILPEPKYQYQYTVDINDIGLTSGSFQVFWAMECGNDGAEWKGDIPEPTTMVLLGSGLLALANHRRNRHI